eukprot:3690047-Prymnesium_polylepis.1
MPKRGIFPLEEVAEFFKKPIEDKERQTLQAMPPRELNERLNELSGNRFLVMGVDPGKKELIVAANPDLVPSSHKTRPQLPSTEIDRKTFPGCQAAIRYTSKQRKFETSPGGYILGRKAS